MTRWLVVALVAFAGCGGPQAELVVRLEHGPGPLYIDGVRMEVHVDGETHELDSRTPTVLRLTPGEYVVAGNTAFCADSVCDEEVQRRAYFCRKRFQVRTRTEVTVRWQVRAPCSIR